MRWSRRLRASTTMGLTGWSAPRMTTPRSAPRAWTSLTHRSTTRWLVRCANDYGSGPASGAATRSSPNAICRSSFTSTTAWSPRISATCRRTCLPNGGLRSSPRSRRSSMCSAPTRSGPPARDRHQGRPPVRPPNRAWPGRQAVVSVPSRQAVPLPRRPKAATRCCSRLMTRYCPAIRAARIRRAALESVRSRPRGQPGARRCCTYKFGRFLDPVLLGPAGGPAGPLRLAPAWLLRAKEVLAILLAPTRRTRHRRIDVYALRESLSPSTVKAASAHIYALAVWATLNALPADLHRWEQSDLDDFLAYLATERPNSRTGGQGIDASSIRSYVNTLRTLISCVKRSQTAGCASTHGRA